MNFLPFFYAECTSCRWRSPFFSNFTFLPTLDFTGSFCYFRCIFADEWRSEADAGGDDGVEAADAATANRLRPLSDRPGPLPTGRANVSLQGFNPFFRYCFFFFNFHITLCVDEYYFLFRCIPYFHCSAFIMLTSPTWGNWLESCRCPRLDLYITIDLFLAREQII